MAVTKLGAIALTVILLISLVAEPILAGSMEKLAALALVLRAITETRKQGPRFIPIPIHAHHGHHHHKHHKKEEHHEKPKEKVKIVKVPIHNLHHHMSEMMHHHHEDHHHDMSNLLSHHHMMHDGIKVSFEDHGLQMDHHPLMSHEEHVHHAMESIPEIMHYHKQHHHKQSKKYKKREDGEK